jgi:hypothetical protein
MFSILRIKLPKFSHHTLSLFYSQDQGLSQQHRAINALLRQVEGNLALLLDTGVLTRGVEFARLYGIDL